MIMSVDGWTLLLTMAFNEVSDDVLLNIFSFLRKRDLCSVAKVSRRCRRISYDTSLWKELNLRRALHGHSSDFLNNMIPKKFTSLRRVHFGAMQIKLRTLKSMLSRCRRLETIIFGRGCKLQKSNRKWTLIIPSSIKTLDMRLARGDFDFLLASGPRFQSLLNFGIGRDSYSPNFFPHMFCQAVNLRILDLTNCDTLVDDQLYDVFTRCTLLESLCLIGCRKLVGTFFPNLVRSCRQLRTLLIRYVPINDHVLSSCEWELLPLEEIDISACPEITWVGLSALLAKLNRIRYLNMSYCGIGHAVTDIILQQMLTRGVSSQLEMLDIRWSFLVTAEMLRQFLTNCKRLKYLGIYQSNGVTSSVIAGVAKCLPELRTVEFGGLRQEMLTSSSMLSSLKDHCKQLSIVSLINFCAVSVSCEEGHFQELFKASKHLERVNLCDCSDELVTAARNAAVSSNVCITELWECALPPPVNTLDYVTRA